MQAIEQAGSAVSSQQQNNFKMVLVNNKPMHSWYNWLTAAGINEDQVEVGPKPSSWVFSNRLLDMICGICKTHVKSCWCSLGCWC